MRNTKRLRKRRHPRGTWTCAVWSSGAATTWDPAIAVMKAERKTGTVKFWNEGRGYGFLTTDDYRDVFLHASQWIENDNPRKGERVGFIEDVGRDRRPFARQVTRLSEIG